MPGSQLCDEAKLQPTVFYRWLKQFFEHGAAALERPNGKTPERPDLKAQRRIAHLEERLQTKDAVLAELMDEPVALKKSLGGVLNGQWVPPDTRDQMVDFVRRWRTRTELPAKHFVRWLGITTSKCYDWRARSGKVNEHNAWVPRDHWLEPWERETILDFQRDHPGDGYRRLTDMMLDADTVAVSPATTYRVLRDAGVLRRWNTTPSKKGTGFAQPLAPHEHWPVDSAHLNIAGTCYFLCSLLDGCSRVIVHWELREHMTEIDVELTFQRAREKYPDARPRIISDNGPQFIARDFKDFIRSAR